MEEAGKAIVAILEILTRRGLEGYRSLDVSDRDALQASPKGKLDKVVSQYSLMHPREVSDLANSPVRQAFDANRFIRLEPSNNSKEGYGYLWCRWDFANGEKSGFYYGYYRLAESHTDDEQAKVKGGVPQFIGYRFESPTLRGDVEHKFFHAQPANSMSPDAGLKMAYALPRPDYAPTFPLPVRTVCGLLLCVVLAVLGRRQLEEIIGELEQHRRLARNAHLQEAIRQVREIAT
jgi:hypothetical protein